MNTVELTSIRSRSMLEMNSIGRRKETDLNHFIDLYFFKVISPCLMACQPL